MKRVKLCCYLLVLLIVACFESALATDFRYADALDKTLLFFEAQRSGKLPENQRVKWRGDSGLKDGNQQGVDLVGGYYDAGDHVKFGLPMAFTITMLAWGASDFREEIMDMNQMEHTLKAIRWGTDYFLKAHTEPNVLWAQVGDGDTDHYCWERPEDMTTPRTAFKLDRNSPGSDIAAETAAALAASSLAFKLYNSTYATRLLAHAKQLFSFADRYRGLYVDSIKNANQYYASSGYPDELLWAASWLFRATGEENYLKYVVDNSEYMGGTGWAVTEFSWDNKYAGVQVLLAKVLLDGQGGLYTSTLQRYQAKANYFACACLLKNGGYNIQKTPGGLMYVRDWNNMQYASAAAFVLAVYSDYLATSNAKLTCPEGQIQPEELLKFAKSQADYILGNNPESLSYLIGYGEKYPVHVHHRGASIASISVVHSPVGCSQGFEKWYHRRESNPNVIHGGLVGGPNRNDHFTDDRSEYEQTEPTISGTAPLVGLFSKLHGSSGEKKINNPKQLPTSRSRTYGGASHHPLKHYYSSPSRPVQIVHSLTKSWTVGKTMYYRHKVVIKNNSARPITNLELVVDNLSGPLWGLRPTSEKNLYRLPEATMKPGAEYTVVYIQGGQQASIRVYSFQDNQ